MINARKVAVNSLIKVNREGAYSNITFDKELLSADLNNKDKALATTLFYGVLDRKITIDYIIKKHSKIPIKKISSLTLEAIRIGVYQLLFLEKIPESAAVNESVNIVKHSKESRNSGFVNAILRNVIRNPVKLPDGNSVYDLSVRYSCPEWIIKSFIEDYGINDAVELLKSGLEAPPLTLRVNTLKISPDKLSELLQSEDIKTLHSETVNNTLITLGGMDIKNSNAYKNGFFHVQDYASQIAVSKLEAKPYERILDMCSAPGGKSFTLAQIMENKGEIIANDLYEKRVELIKKGANRLGIDIIKTTVSDATEFNQSLGKFDAVLCDVLCSGWGVLRRKPEIKYKQAEDFKELENTQQKLFNTAAKYLKKNGRLLYSTCTLRKNENERAVERFLKENSNFSLEYQHTFMPHNDGTDGFFCALLVKN